MDPSANQDLPAGRSGQPVRLDDLAAHITASLREHDNLFVTHSHLADFVAADLLADFRITTN